MESDEVLAMGPAGRADATLVRFRTVAGEWRTLSVLLTDMRFAAGVSGIVANSRDVTEQRQLAEELRLAQRLESVGQLAGGVAHDFNNVLTPILGFSDLALLALPQEHPVRGDIEEIRVASLRAAALTRQLLAFSRQQVLMPRVVNVNVITTHMEAMLRRLLGGDVDVSLSLAEDIGNVLIDTTQLEQVLMNLVVNARDAIPASGMIRIVTSEEYHPAQSIIEGTVVSAGRYVALRVTDDGTGMDAATRARAFDPFFTTKATGDGTGLGLSTVYGIVKQSGGYIWVRSEPGVGTTFCILLPVTARALEQEQRQEQEMPREPVEATTLPNAVSILVVDDEPAVQSLTRRIRCRFSRSRFPASCSSARCVRRCAARRPSQRGRPRSPASPACAAGQRHSRRVRRFFG